MSILASDNFNRADENPLGNGVWTVAPSQDPMKLVTNAATFQTNNDSISYYSGITWPDNQYSKAKLTVDGSIGGDAGGMLVVRQSAAAHTHYRLATDHAATNNVSISKHVAAAYTNIAQFTQAWTDGDTWELRVQGTTISAWRNGVQVGTNQVDTSITSGSPGIGWSTPGNSMTIDDWEGGDFAAVGGFVPDEDYLIFIPSRR